MNLAKVFGSSVFSADRYFIYVFTERERADRVSQKLYSESHHSCPTVSFSSIPCLTYPPRTSAMSVCLVYWIDVKFDWITKFWKLMQVSITLWHRLHRTHFTDLVFNLILLLAILFLSLSFSFILQMLFRHRQCIKCQIQLLMHPHVKTINRSNLNM